MRNSLFIVLSAVLLAAAVPGSMTAQTQPQLSLDVLFGDERPHGESARPIAWHPEKPLLLLRWDETGGGENQGHDQSDEAEPDADDTSGEGEDGDGAARPDTTAWWLFDAASGETTLLARPADFGVEKARQVGGFSWTPDGTALFVRVEGELALFDVAARSLRRITGEPRGDETEAVEQDGDDAGSEAPEASAAKPSARQYAAPDFSPDGSKLGFVRDDELWVLDVASGEEQRLTHDADPGTIFNGTTDWVYWEEIWNRSAKAYWWSGDSRRIAYYHFDDRDVPVYTLVDTEPLYPETNRQRYPKAGDVLPKVEIRVLDLVTFRSVTLQTGEERDQYLARVDWHPDGRRLAIQRLNRDQTRIELLFCSVEDGACEVVTKIEWPTWVNLSRDLTFLADGRFLWSDESSGWRRIYLYDADGGERRALTPEGWAVTSLLEVNEAAGWIAFQAFPTGRLGAAERHLFRGDLNGGAARRLTTEAGNHSGRFSPTGHYVHLFSNATTPWRQTVRHVDDPAQVHELPSRPPSYDVDRLPIWELLTLPGPDGQELPAMVLKPGDFDSSRKYPVLMYHYGCPGSQVVRDTWPRAGRDFWHLMMAEKGYVVMAVDNVGSQFFGKRGEDKMHRLFGQHELDAALAAVDYLKDQPWADTGRLGLWGWSGGGYSTLFSVLNAPGVWRAAMAGAPVVDWRYYDAIWTERYLDTPQDNAEGYERSSAMASAERLADHLLMIHGTGDDNVHPQNTLNTVSKLIQAGKPVELGIYPNMKHGMSSIKGGEFHVLSRMTEFFDRHLRPGGELVLEQPVHRPPDG